MNKSIEEFLELMQDYSQEEQERIKKAYELAKELHKNQLRDSGEPYIIHPINVAYNVATIMPDADSICAAFLHDTLEDTDITKEELITLFNSTIANLVDGVTNFNKSKEYSKTEKNNATLRKLVVTALQEDVRILLIKLCDKLHNMRTLEYKPREKQIKTALETLKFYAPLAYHLGVYRIKTELEDIAFSYINPERYQDLRRKREEYDTLVKEDLYAMSKTIEEVLKQNNIQVAVKIRSKNIYGIHNRLESGHKFSDMFDLLCLKIVVEKQSDCYQALGLIHFKYHPINGKFKDYICNPKTNLYQSLHTTVFGENGHLVQVQIRTEKMDKIASFGLAAYWQIYEGNAYQIMQEDFKNCQIYKSLEQINEIFENNHDFVEHVEEEVLSKKIYVYSPKGDAYALPVGATPIDFAYAVHTDIGNNMIRAFVNDEEVPLTTILKNKDRVRVITSNSSSFLDSKMKWDEIVITALAKRKIRECRKKKQKKSTQEKDFTKGM